MSFLGVGAISPSIYPAGVSLSRSLALVNKFADGHASTSVMGDKMGESNGSYYEPFFEEEEKNKEEKTGEIFFLKEP